GDVRQGADGRQVRGGDLRGDLVHGGGVGDVEGVPLGGDPELGGEVVGERAGALAVEVEDRHGPALAGEAGGGGPADAARTGAAGDDCGPALAAGGLWRHLSILVTSVCRGGRGPFRIELTLWVRQWSDNCTGGPCSSSQANGAVQRLGRCRILV